MLGIIGLALILVGVGIYVFSRDSFFDERVVIVMAVLVTSGFCTLIVHGATTMPEPEEAASVRESREAVKEMARQAEAEAWYAQQKRVNR